MNTQPTTPSLTALEGTAQMEMVAQVQAESPILLETASTNAAMSATPIALALVGVLAFTAFLKTCLQICNPNEILILSGRKRKTKRGQSVGYRVIFGGHTVVIPILERVERMDMTTMPVPVEVKNAYSKGGIPLHIQAIANVKVSSNPNVVGNAIERFLGRSRNEIKRVARETLEGNLRGVVADLTPE